MKKKIVITTKCDEKGYITKGNHLETALNYFAEHNFEVYGVHWQNINQDLNVKKAHHINSGKIITDINLNDIADIFHIRQMGKIYEDLEKLENILEKTKTDFYGIMINPAETIQYGLTKDYLLDLQEKEFPVPYTLKVESNLSIEQLKRMVDDGNNYLIKPWNGEQGKYVQKLNRTTNEDLKNISKNSKYLLLQEFMPQIVDGEKSLIYIGDKFSHAVIKTPEEGSFLTNLHQKGKVRKYTPTNEEIELGFNIKNSWGHKLNIFRVDIAEHDDEPSIIEVETVNPSYFIQHLDPLCTDLNKRLLQYYQSITN